MRDDEQLRAALMDLRSDVATLPMRPAGEVRARGDQRTRRRRAALAGTSALAVATVVGVTALTTGAPQAGRTVPPATSLTSSPTPSATPSATASPNPSPTPSAEAGPPPLYATSGTVDPGLFLPADRWAGPDLAAGHATRWQAVTSEGLVQVHTCDVDTRLRGDVALAQVADATTSAPLGTQRVRTYASPAAATAAVADLTDGLRRCQARLDQVPGNNLQVTIAEDPVLANAFVTYPVAAYRVDVGTVQGGQAGIEWVGVVAAEGGTNVATIVVNEPPATTKGFTTLRRLIAGAVGALEPSSATTTPTTPSTTAPAATLVLEPDGLGLVVGPASIRHLTFAGATTDQVTAQLRAALGSGTTNPSPDCGVGRRTFSSGGLSVLLKGSRFLGWTYQAPAGSTGVTARTADGIGAGSTLAELRAARPRVTVTTATLGPEFVGPGGLSGLLTGTSGSSTVTLLRAGETCSFR